MNRILFSLIALLPLALAPATAQDTPPKAAPDTARAYSDEFRRGVEALTAERWEEGMASMKRCLELAPEDSASAYNLACAHSRQNQIDAGIEWLGKSASWGFGYDPFTDLSALADKDTDIDNLRKDPRFPPILETIHARKKNIEAYIDTPAVYIPKAAEAGGPMPVLVVLHPSGATKDSVITGRWKQVADDLGYALVAPSARMLANRETKQGMVWYRSFSDYAKADRSPLYEKSVMTALESFQKTHPVDTARVFIAGESEGGMVALRLAFSHPKTWKGVVASDVGLETTMLKPHAPAAKAAGLKVKLLLDRDAFAARLAADPKRKIDPAVVLSAWNDNLVQMGFPGSLEAWSKDPAAAGDPLTAKFVASLRAMQTTAAEASAPK